MEGASRHLCAEDAKFAPYSLFSLSPADTEVGGRCEDAGPPLRFVPFLRAPPAQKSAAAPRMPPAHGKTPGALACTPSNNRARPETCGNCASTVYDDRPRRRYQYDTAAETRGAKTAARSGRRGRAAATVVVVYAASPHDPHQPLSFNRTAR